MGWAPSVRRGAAPRAPRERWNGNTAHRREPRAEAPRRVPALKNKPFFYFHLEFE
jgi:hypothetical protein